MFLDIWPDGIGFLGAMVHDLVQRDAIIKCPYGSRLPEVMRS